MRPTIGINMDVASVDGRLLLLLPTDYVDSVVEAGGRPRLIACVNDEALLREGVDAVDAFLFVGGGGPAPGRHGDAAGNPSAVGRDRAITARGG